MRDASKLLLAAGLICGVMGIVWHMGLVAVTGVVMLIAGLLVRSLAPRPAQTSSDVERPRFGPTSVASTVPGGGGRPFDAPRD
jgi:membrane-bound ClpP family serine protease